MLVVDDEDGMDRVGPKLTAVPLPKTRPLDNISFLELDGIALGLNGNNSNNSNSITNTTIRHLTWFNSIHMIIHSIMPIQIPIHKIVHANVGVHTQTSIP